MVDFCAAFRELVQALYHERTFLKYLLRGLFIAEQITMAVVFGITLSQMTFGVHCVVIGFPSLSAAFLCVASLYATCYFLTSFLVLYRCFSNSSFSS